MGYDWKEQLTVETDGRPIGFMSSWAFSLSNAAASATMSVLCIAGKGTVHPNIEEARS
jgi:hypothetical protein